MTLHILALTLLCLGILVVVLSRWLHSAHTRLEESFRQFDEITASKNATIAALEETIILLE